MRVLLDTHIFLWAISDDDRLSAAARSLILAAGPDVHVSAASIWEISIKRGLARGRPGDMPLSAQAAVDEAVAGGFLLLPISPAHATAVETLPPLHGDPFDRLLIAQASVEGLRLLTADRALTGYGASVVPV